MKKAFTLILFLFCVNSFCQRYYNDARLWLNIYLEKEITKKFIVHLNHKDRFDNNISRYELGYADIGVTYKFSKNIKVLGDYVFAIKQKKNKDLQNRHQFYAAVILSKEFGRFKIMYRNLFQVSYNDLPDGAYLPRYADRNKITLKYEATKRYSFYVAQELFLTINNPQFKGFYRSRSFAGTFIKTSKHQQLELYFCFQAQLQRLTWYKQKESYPNIPLSHNYIYGVGYSIEF